MDHFLNKKTFLKDLFPLRISSGEGELSSNDLTVKRHYHNFHELVFIARGRGQHIIDGQTFEVQKGILFLILPGQHHFFKNRVDMKHINIAFDLEELPLPHELIQAHPGFHPLFKMDPLLRQHGNQISHISFSSSQVTKLLHLFEEMFRAQPNHSPKDKLLLITLFQNLLITLLDYYATPSSEEGKKLIKLSNVMLYIEKNFKEPLTLDQLASIAEMKKSTFHRQFQAVTKTSPIHYLNELRIDYATEMLKMSEMKITDIAYNAGFNDSNYFSRLFKKMKGISPASVRRG